MPAQRALHSRTDPTKRVGFNLDAITSGTEVVIVVPDYGGTLFETSSIYLDAAIPNLAATNLHLALAELQSDIDLLTALSNADYIAGNGPPSNSDGADGNYYLDVVAGDVYGPKASGTWPPTPVGNIYSFTTVMSGATALSDGAIGLVPQPMAGDHVKFLRGDGTWASVYLSSTPTWSTTGVMASRSVVKDDMTQQEIIEALGTLVVDLKARGVIP